MQVADFGKLAPGRLVPSIDGVLAFLPESVPRALPLTSKAVSLVADAEHALGRLAGATDRLINPHLVGAPLLKREAILSSRIEGTITTAEELVVVESGGPEARPDTREVLNYVRAMEHGIRRLAEIPVSLRLIRELHRVLMEDVHGEEERPGEFRTTQNYIGRPGSTIREARFVPPPPAHVPEAMSDLERFHHDDACELPVLVRIALEHYQFEAIHPFRDGNGRIGRLLIPLSLIERGKLPAPVLYPSRYFERNRDAYADLLLRVSQKGDFLAWVEFFLRGLVESADDARAQVEGLLALRTRFQTKLQEARSSALLLKLVDRLFQSPAITFGEAARVLQVTPAAANANVRKLVRAGILTETTGRKRNRVFIAKEIVAFIRDEGGPVPEQKSLPFEPPLET